MRKKIMIKRIRIGTRSSPLALWQAKFIKDKINRQFPEINVSLLHIKTDGDRDKASSLTQIGGQGIFTKAIENSLLANEIDMAVHSLKDLPTVFPDALNLSAVPERGSVHDVFIGSREKDFWQLNDNATIASGSIRRRSQLKSLKPHLNLADLRGNIETRLKKLKQNQFDGIIMAEVALLRLELNEVKCYRFSLEEMLPAVGQGAIAVQTRMSDVHLEPVLNYINDSDTRSCVSAERAFLRLLDSGCQFPVAAYACIEENDIYLRGLIASTDGRQVLKDSLRGPVNNSEEVGVQLAEKLIERGGLDILSEG
jgi:hydroxymethylbilane synthase